VVFSVVVFGGRCRWILLGPGLALALAGIFLVMTQGSELSPAGMLRHAVEDPRPFLLALLAAITWAAYSILTRRLAVRSGVESVAGFLAASGGALLVAHALSGRTPAGHWSAAALGEAAALGTATAVAYAGWDRAMREGDLLLVAACSFLTPLLSTTVSCLYLGVMPAPRLWTGCALLVVGSWLTWRGTR